MNLIQVQISAVFGARFSLREPLTAIISDDDGPGLIDPANLSASSLKIGDDDQGPITNITFRTISVDDDGMDKSFEVAIIERSAVADYVIVAFNLGLKFDPANLSSSHWK